MVEIIDDTARGDVAKLDVDDGPRARFARAYAGAVARWPVPVTAQTAATDYGATHLLTCGSGPAVLLLPGGGATATAWAGVAGALSAGRRVVAVDPVGQPGLTTGGERPVRAVADLTGWLDQVLASLAAERLTLVGHSYGAWMALRYALHAPGRVDRLVLLDPTTCFAPLSLRYRLHAVPLLLRPRAARARRLLAWETRGRSLDPAWLCAVACGADLGRPAIVLPRLPRPGELAGLRVPVLVVVAGASQAHDPGRVAARAARLLPDARVVTVAAATHHTMPTEDVADLAGHIQGFLA
jgi:pimeloyl-ACP methyl ester carboxylesterase